VIAAVQGWLAGRSERERRLIGVAAVVCSIVAAGALALAAWDDVTALQERVAARERELAAVRRLAATVAARPAGDDVALMTRVQTATDAAQLADRVAAMTPDAGGSRLSVRVSGASLAETVQLLYALAEGRAAVDVARLGLAKHRDDPRRFELTLDLAQGASPAAP
jgi:hypothetical protein